MENDRYDYETVSSEAANAMMAHLEAMVQDPRDVLQRR
jgi:hypothetical protein